MRSIQKGSWKVGQWRGVPLRIHFTLLFLLFWLAFVTQSRFDLITQDAGIPRESISGSPWVWGVVFAVSLLASVAAHEFAHVFQAIREGAPVRSVTLMMLGGVSEIEEVPESRYGEMRLALIGPAFSVALGVGLLLFRRIKGLPNEVAFYSHWLGSANLVLGLFNLLPAFPLDGGRALRSYLTARKGPLAATQTAVRLSRGVAWALGILGLLTFNVLLMLIAFFISVASQGELFHLMTRSLIRGLRVSDLLVPVSPVSPGDPLDRVAQRLIESGITSLPVELESSGPPSEAGSSPPAQAGVVTLARIRDIPRNFRHLTLVRDIMITPDSYPDLEQPLSDIMNELSQTPGGALPVRQTEQNRVVGLIRWMDVMQVLQIKSLESEEQIPPTRDFGLDRAA
jgi:Zn-dependent protease